MTDIRFYHMERSPLEKTLPALVSKALSQGHRILIKTPSPASAETLSAHLWTYDDKSFLPHGTAKDGNANLQPIFLTSADENPNNADVLILTGGAQSDKTADFKLCCDLLDGRNPENVQAARTRWKAYKDEGFDVTYWQQGEKGWEEKTANKKTES